MYPGIASLNWNKVYAVGTITIIISSLLSIQNKLGGENAGKKNAHL